MEPIKPTDGDLEEMRQWMLPGGGVLPHVPTSTTTHNVRLPDPPMLDAALTDLEMAKAVVKLYRGAVERLWKQPCFVFSKHDDSIKESKLYKGLVEGARTLRDLGIAPASWIMFSFDMWREAAKGEAGKKAPPLNYVFSAKRIVDRRGWFEREASSYGGGLTILSSEHKELLRRNTELQFLKNRVVHRLNKQYGFVPKAELREALFDLVDEIYPGGYAAWLERARTKGEEQKAELKALIAAGEFIWGC